MSKLKIGDIVYVQGYQFRVIAIQPDRPEAPWNDYFTGEVTEDSRNDSIRCTTYARGEYSALKR